MDIFTTAIPMFNLLFEVMKKEIKASNITHYGNGRGYKSLKTSTSIQK